MLRSLTDLFRHLADSAQLSFEFEAPPRTGSELLERLRALGLRQVDRVRLTRNRTVMVSYARGELRLHEGFLRAPSEVLQAIVIFVEGRTRVERNAARHVILAYPIKVADRPKRPPEKMRPEDEALAAEFTAWHRQFNLRHFNGELRRIPIRVSRRMKSRLGHYTAATPREPAEIAISWRHIHRHGAEEALHTLLHEMVHQWQDERGFTIDHGPRFRSKAMAVGIAPSARRSVAGRRGRGRAARGTPRRAARTD